MILLIAIFGPLIVQTDPNATVGGLYDKPAGWGPLLLGTDNEGQSVIANLVYGTRTSLIVGLIAGTIATVIGLAVGLIAGFKGGLVDNILSSVTNIFAGHPGHHRDHPDQRRARQSQHLRPGPCDRRHAPGPGWPVPCGPRPSACEPGSTSTSP